jgi:Zn-finger nucleic acid-binding protein
MDRRLVNAATKEQEMKCPVCKTPDLLMADRQGIEIDYCPTCRGVWLDRGELDKLIERAAQEYSGAAATDLPAAARSTERRDEDQRASPDAEWGRSGRTDAGQPERRYPQKNKKSLFGELFDFD